MKPPPTGSSTRRQFVAGTAASIAVSRARGADPMKPASFNLDHFLV